MYARRSLAAGAVALSPLGEAINTRRAERPSRTGESRSKAVACRSAPRLAARSGEKDAPSAGTTDSTRPLSSLARSRPFVDLLRGLRVYAFMPHLIRVRSLLGRNLLSKERAKCFRIGDGSRKPCEAAVGEAKLQDAESLMSYPRYRACFDVRTARGSVRVR